MKTLRCECGQKVLRKDIVHQAYSLRSAGDCFVYLKFRCSRCNRLCEKFFRNEDWMPESTRDMVEQEVTRRERALISQQGPITDFEIDSARTTLEVDGLTTLSSYFDPK